MTDKLKPYKAFCKAKKVLERRNAKMLNRYENIGGDE